MVLPPVNNQVDQSGPVAQTINSTINIINTVTKSVAAPTPVTPLVPATSSPPATGTTSGDATGGANTATSTAATPAPDDTKKDDAKKDEKKDDKNETVLAKDTGAKKDEPVKKLYCN